MCAKKTIFILFVTTAIALAYVHLRISNIVLSYKINLDEKKYYRLLDYNAHLKYNILALGSCANLEKTLVARNAKIIWPAERKVIALASAGKPVRLANGTLKNARAILASIFTLKREAYANPVRDRISNGARPLNPPALPLRRAIR